MVLVTHLRSFLGESSKHCRRNSVTRCTTACFEPSLDYCVAKAGRQHPRKAVSHKPVAERTAPVQLFYCYLQAFVGYQKILLVICVYIYMCVCNPSLSLSVSVAKCYYISCRQVRRTSKRYASFESNLAACPARFTWVFLSLVSTQVPFDHRKPCETAGCLTQPGAPLGSAEVLHRGLPYRRLGCRFLDHFWAI